MPKYQLADNATKELANEILFKFATADRGIYQEIIDNRVRIDILFAYGDRDEETGERVNSASHGAANFLERVLLPILQDHAPINIIAVADGMRCLFCNTSLIILKIQLIYCRCC